MARLRTVNVSAVETAKPFATDNHGVELGDSKVNHCATIHALAVVKQRRTELITEAYRCGIVSSLVRPEITHRQSLDILRDHVDLKVHQFAGAP